MRKNRYGDMIAYLDDFLVRHTSKEYVLFILVRMELDNVWNLAIAEPFQALASLGVPQFHLTVIPTRQKLATVI